MKLKLKGKMTFLLLLFSLLFTLISAAADSTNLTITMRIEGMEETLYYEILQVPADGSLTVSDVLLYVNSQTPDLNIIGIEGGFISSVKGETSGAFGGWDGWMYTVNGEEALVGISECLLNDNDSVLLYYGDPYGVGMQFPHTDLSKISQGIIKFTSSDTTFDQDFNPITTVNPVASAKVTFLKGEFSVEFTTDDNGEIDITEAGMPIGVYTVQIEKYSDDTVDGKRLPLVLRFSPDYTISIETSFAADQSKSPAEDTSKSDEGIPKTDTESGLVFILALAAFAVILYSIIEKARVMSFEK